MSAGSELALEAMRLALVINEETPYCVFVNYSGHVACVDIDLSSSKVDYADKLAHSWCELEYPDGVEKFRKVVATMAQIAETKQLPELERQRTPSPWKAEFIAVQQRGAMVG